MLCASEKVGSLFLSRVGGFSHEKKVSKRFIIIGRGWLDNMGGIIAGVKVNLRGSEHYAFRLMYRAESMIDAIMSMKDGQDIGDLMASNP